MFSFTDFSSEELVFYRGIEKESLRALNTSLALTQHPKTLGSALMNKFITMDYSESLIEMVTPPFDNVDSLVNFLDNLHIFVNKNLASDETLWSASMPCILGEDSDIPIANFGQSNIGKMKHIYRRGLGHRYSRKMQSIAGVHYNFSFTDSFWYKYARVNNLKENLRQIKDKAYFHIIRNIHRYSDLFIYLFACSPIADESFLKKSANKCLTSIRMSKFGYTSDKQKKVAIRYDDLNEYNETLTKFIHKKDKDYQLLGIKDGEEYRQLSDCVLQVEDEFYNIVRPKQKKGKGLTPSKKLLENGIEYIEFRLLDLDLFSPIGINKEQIYFLDLFFLFCLQESSPLIDKEEFQLIEKNRRCVINSGCQENFIYGKKQQNISFKSWGENIFKKLFSIADQLDEVLTEKKYSQVVNIYHDKFNQGDNLTRRFKKELKKEDLSFVDFVKQKNSAYKKYFLEKKEDQSIQKILAQEVNNSLQKQEKLEQEDHLSFEEFLQQYYNNA